MLFWITKFHLVFSGESEQRISYYYTEVSITKYMENHLKLKTAMRISETVLINKDENIVNIFE